MINKMLRRSSSLEENEEKVLRKRQQVKYYKSSSSEDDAGEKFIQSKRRKKPVNKSRSSDTDDPDFESEDSDFDDKRTYQKKGEHSSKKKESMSEYEKQLLEKRTANLDFLKTIGMEEAKDDFFELKPKKRMYIKKDYSESSNGPRRVSQREKAQIDYDEESKKEANLQTELGTFKDLLKSKNDYECFVDECKEILEADDFPRTPVLYDRDVLKQLTKIAFVPSDRLYHPSAMSWYPSSEHLILAIGNGNGNVTLWNIEDSHILHKFSSRSKKISSMQFNPWNAFHLISSSWDGTLVCCDMQKQIFSEVLRISDHCCTYFDCFSPSSYLMSLTNGQVVIVDRRNPDRGKYHHKRYTCHDSCINSIHVHPVEKNYFVTAGKDRKIRIWDLRYLSRLSTPIVEKAVFNKNVVSAFFSPLSGKYLLSASSGKICIFDSTEMTGGTLKLHKSIKSALFKCGSGPIRDSISVPVWLPNSDDMFSWLKEKSLNLQIYDKDFNVYETLTDGLLPIKMLNEFHPFKPALASIAASGSLKILAEKNI